MLFRSRSILNRALQGHSQLHLRSHLMPKVALQLLQLQEMGLGLPCLRCPLHEPRGQVAPPLNPKKLHSKLLLQGKGSSARRALQKLLCLYLYHIKGSRLLLLKKLTPTSQACQCPPLTLKPPWTLRQMLGTTLSFIFTSMTSVFPFNDT